MLRVIYYCGSFVFLFYFAQEGAQIRNNCTGCKSWVSMECEILDTDEPLTSEIILNS